jgi:2-polyprenyl-3-methyl-5-hydroxy-6-metoxy-1,4-benzoquinol methylase
MRLELDQIQEFYERCYKPAPDGAKWARWRELGAVTKADHVTRLLEQAGVADARAIAEVGCGDGSVLVELGRRGIGEIRVGFDISSSAVELAAGRPGITAARLFDGERIPVDDGAYDLVIATHVLEHVPMPPRLVAELARVTRQAVVIEVPLERNLSARRPAARAASHAAGHLHAFGRSEIRRMVAQAGWLIRAEVLDPLPRAVHMFGKATPAGRARGQAKWLIRNALATVPSVGERLVTLHYALIATPR